MRHCVCCPHYVKHWKVDSLDPLFPGWFMAIPPTDSIQEQRCFRSEAEAVEYARFMRDHPRVVYAGRLAPRGYSMTEMMFVFVAIQNNDEIPHASPE